jgi:hypothetical protein
MDAIKAIVKAGRVDVQVPPQWPDGTEVEIQPLEQSGTSEPAGPMTPDEIARTLAAMDKVEPFEMTSEQAAALNAWERKVKEYTITNMDRGIEDVFR